MDLGILDDVLRMRSIECKGHRSNVKVTTNLGGDVVCGAHHKEWDYNNCAGLKEISKLAVVRFPF